jgi:hypothetical protein
MAEIRNPYRDDVRAQTRARLDADLQALEHLVRSGATFFITPEGRYTTDGRMGRFRAAYDRLAPLAQVYIVPCSYDVFRGRRFSLLYRIIGPVPAAEARDLLPAARPVTTSQLVAEFVAGANGAFTETAVIAAVERRLAGLPTSLFVDPELRADPARVVREALAKMVRLRILEPADAGYRLAPVRVHPKFPRVTDIVAFQVAFLGETLAADERVRAWPPEVGGGVG